MNQKKRKASVESQTTPRISLAVQYASQDQHLPTRAQLRRWFRVALNRDVNITLRLVDEAEGREINSRYRGKNYATNVLTFVYDDPAPPDLDPLSEESVLHGDVVMCVPVVAREATAQHKKLLAHYAHLAIHAALHLQGYDHKNEADAHKMESLETALMLKLRYPDPYRVIRYL
jgi:probable rRNA maturation factor